MRHLLLLIVFACSALAVDFPTDIPLANGAVLHKTHPERFETDYVVVRHLGGIDPIRYANIREPQRAQVLAAKSAANAADSAPRSVTGQVYITTRGSAVYKLAAVVVYAYPQSSLSIAAEIVRSKLADNPKLSGNLAHQLLWRSAFTQSRPVASATTNADGKFEITIPSGEPVLLFATSSRDVIDDTEYYTWVIPNAAGTVELNNSNLER